MNLIKIYHGELIVPQSNKIIDADELQRNAHEIRQRPQEEIIEA